MRLERRQREPALPGLGAIFGGVLFTSGALTALWMHLGLPLPVCLFRQWTGLPCPTCGSTRMAEALLAGDPLTAMTWNPLVFLGLSAVALWALLSAARLVSRLPGWRIVLARSEWLGLRIVTVAAVALGWIYLVWRGV